jgi:hypothetical protein
VNVAERNGEDGREPLEGMVCGTCGDRVSGLQSASGAATWCHLTSEAVLGFLSPRNCIWGPRNILYTTILDKNIYLYIYFPQITLSGEYRYLGNIWPVVQNREENHQNFDEIAGLQSKMRDFQF